MSTPATKQRRVLVVEDDNMVRRLLATVLEQGGYAVEQAGNGIEALVSIDTEPVDLILLDLLMPVMDGMKFLRQLRQVRKLDIPVLVLTASLDQAGGDEQRILDAGANRVVRKPVGSAQLLELVQQTLDT